MCGRFLLKALPVELQQVFRFDSALPNLRPRYNIAPSQEIAIVRRRAESESREMAQVR